MFNSRKRININSVKINDRSFESLGLFLDEDYIFNIPPLVKEYEEIPVPGMNGSYTKFIRYGNREFDIEFQLKESRDYHNKLFFIQDVLDAGGIITLNNEEYGYKLKRYSIDNQSRGIGSNAITIHFICMPFIHKKDGTEIKNR